MYLARSSPTVLTWFMDASSSGLQRPHSGTPRPPGVSTPSQPHTIEVLRRLRAEAPDRKLIVLWDGAPYHRAKAVRMVATDPPPLEWPILKYGFQAEGGSRCARSDIPPKRSFPSCARSMFGSPRAPRWRMPFARSG